MMYLVMRFCYFFKILAELYCPIVFILILLCLFLYKCFRFLSIPTRLVVEGGLVSMYGTVWAYVYVGNGVMRGLVVPLMTSMFAWLLL
jgi:hypothetical protein